MRLYGQNPYTTTASSSTLNRDPIGVHIEQHYMTPQDRAFRNSILRLPPEKRDRALEEYRSHREQEEIQRFQNNWKKSSSTDSALNITPQKKIQILRQFEKNKQKIKETP